MKKVVSVVGILVCVVGALVAKQLAKEHLAVLRSKQPKNGRSVPLSHNQSLNSISTMLNHQLPTMLDETTRLDSTSVEDGELFVYSYTLVGVTTTEIEDGTFKKVFTKQMYPQLLNNYRTSPDMKLFRDLNAELLYVYRDEDGTVLEKITVSPSDFSE